MTLVDYLREAARRGAERVAVVDPSGSRLTYAELDRQSDALAASLATAGVGRGDRVGLALPKGLPAVVSIFGIMKAGAAYVPVDIGSPAERARRILEDCRVAAVILDPRFAPMLPERRNLVAICAGHETIRVPSGVQIISYERAIQKDLAATVSASPQVVAADLAYIIYTSGSTGMPKGVMITHGNVVSFIEWCSSEFHLRGDDRFGNYSPLHFDPSVFDLYAAVKHGAAVYLISEPVGRNPPALAAFIAEHALTVWISTPGILAMLVEMGCLEAYDTSSLRLGLFGGEVFPVKHLRGLQRRWPAARLYNLYGPTETTVACTFFRIPEPIPATRETPYPIGRPCTHARAAVFDERGEPVLAGKEGLLHISGPSVFQGYWNRPDATAAAFVERDGMRWYNTGDVVTSDREGVLSFVGRRDRMIKRRGFRIELGEIEAAVHTHPLVHEGAVVAVPHDRGVRLIAFVRPAGTERLSLVALKTYLSSRLPAYMIPDDVVVLERLPRTSTDKVDHEALVREASGVAGAV